MSQVSPPIPAKPIIVEGRVAPALLVQAVRMAFIMAASGAAGHLIHGHPTLAGAFADPTVYGSIGVALVNAGWSLYARVQLCTKLKRVAEYVDDSIAVIRR